MGRDPDPRVIALGRTPGVVVTGTVADVRPYIASARGVVASPRRRRHAPQDLEAMAMARPVVSTAFGAEGLTIAPGTTS